MVVTPPEDLNMASASHLQPQQRLAAGSAGLTMASGTTRKTR